MSVGHYYSVCVETFTAMSRQVSLPGRGDLGPDEGNHRILLFDSLWACRCAPCIASSRCSPFHCPPILSFLPHAALWGHFHFPHSNQLRTTYRKEKGTRVHVDKWFNVLPRGIYAHICVCCQCLFCIFLNTLQALSYLGPIGGVLL